MKKLKILRIEVIFQLILTIVCALLWLIFSLDSDIDYIVAGSLLIVGIFNVSGFIFRIIIVKHKLNVIYGYLVLLFFIVLFSIYGTISNSLDGLYIQILGSVFNLFYVGYGFIILKNRNSELALHKK